MAEPQAPVQKSPIVVDPAAAEPVTITATEASTDPVRPLATDSLTAASRAEVTPTGNAATEAPVVGPKEGNLAKNEEVVEAQPINEGVLGYKGPGLVKYAQPPQIMPNPQLICIAMIRSLIFSKKFFWFSDEPLEPEHLSGYLRTEKAEIAHHNVAHASQTGKGLLFFAKRVEDKDHPAGILNLVGSQGPSS